MPDPQYLEQLVQRLVALDEGAYEEFALSFGPLLLRYFVRHGLPYFEAEDLAASCVTDIAMKVRKYRPGGSFGAWVFAIARNRLADDRKKAIQVIEAVQEPSTPFETEPWIDVEVALHVQTVIADLSEQDRILVLGRALNSRPYEELAGELGITVEAARVRYSRAKRDLESRLLQAPAIQKKIERSRHSRITA